MASSTDTAKVAVQLIVENIGKFKNDIGQANNALGIIKTTLTKLKGFLDGINTPLTNIFKNLGNSIKNFAQNILGKILTIAFGVLVRDSIRKVIDVIGEMIGAFVDASNEFQRLRVRLNTFNMQPLIEGGMSFEQAMRKASKATAEQLDWVLKLAKTTPYDAVDVANAYSLARSYGFIDKKAKILTDSIMDFASGMALDNTAIEKIITNFGQMVQQGKITGTELRDLARGAFVPVNKVLEIAAKRLGITIEKLNEMRAAGTAKPEWFIDAFVDLVDKDFKGASERMSRTFKSAMDNMKDTFVGLAGLKIGIPIFDVLGGKIADLVEAFNDVRYAKLTKVFESIGKSISDIINKLFGLLPSTTAIADAILKTFENIAMWLQDNKGAIVQWVKDAVVWLGKFWNVLMTQIIPAIAKFIGWIYNNREEIGKWIVNIGKAWLILEGIVIVLRLVVDAVLKFITALIAAKTAVWAVKTFLSLMGVSLGEILVPIALVVGALVLMGTTWFLIGRKWAQVGASIMANWDSIVAWFQNGINNIVAIFNNTPWWQLGFNVIAGIQAGIQAGIPKLLKLMSIMASELIYIWNLIWGIKSPSKVMENSGNNMMKGLSKGITKGAKKAIDATKAVASEMAGIVNGMVTGGSTTTTAKAATKSGSSGGGTTTTTGGHYLNQTGELMNKKLDATKGTDPCSKNSTAKCLAESLKKGLGDGLSGIGDDITDAMADWSALLGDLVAGIGGEAKAGNEAYIKTLEKTRFGFSESAMKLVDGTNKWTAITARDTLENVKDTGYNISQTAVQKMSSIHDKAWSNMQTNVTIIGGFVQNVWSAITSFISGYSNSKESQKTTQTKNTNTTTTQITNNFHNTHAGQQVTWDTESMHFWL